MNNLSGSVFLSSARVDYTDQVMKLKELVKNTELQVKTVYTEQIENIEHAFLKNETVDVNNIDDTEIVQWNEICCKSIKISSSGRTRHLYPFILGDYKITERKSNTPIYNKQDLFLFKPARESSLHSYSWGVSRSPLARWGYIRSSLAGGCPDMGGRWKVYDGKMNRWAKDITLVVKCNRK